MAAKIPFPLEHSLALAEPLPRRAAAVPRLASHLLDTLAAPGPESTCFTRSSGPGCRKRWRRIVQANGERLLRGNIRNLAAMIVDNRQGRWWPTWATSAAARRRSTGRTWTWFAARAAPGSILKPFLYAAMLQEGGLTPRTLLADTPVHFAGYVPENFDRRFRGAVPARDALAWSLNIPAIRMLQQFGIPRFYNLLKKWGFSTLARSPGSYGLTLILGGAEGTLFDITALYSRLAQLALGDAARRREIRLLRSDVPRRSRMADLGPAAAWLTLEALTEVNRPDQEGFWKQFSSSKWVAWKTGTSFGLRDAWSVGVTPAYTVGVWAGNADGEGNPDLTGLATAAPVLFEILQALDTGGAIPPPRLWLKEIRVCRDSGFLAGEIFARPSTAGMPVESHFQQPCPFHQLVHLDESRRYPGRFQLRIARAHGPRTVVRPAAGAGILLPALPPRVSRPAPFPAGLRGRFPGRGGQAGHQPRLPRRQDRRLRPGRSRRPARPGGFRGRPPRPRGGDLLAPGRALPGRHPPLPPGRRRARGRASTCWCLWTRTAIAWNAAFWSSTATAEEKECVTY